MPARLNTARLWIGVFLGVSLALAGSIATESDPTAASESRPPWPAAL